VMCDVIQLGETFRQMTSIVASQAELVQRIDENTVSAHEHISLGQVL
jgi:hypothetical protein